MNAIIEKIKQVRLDKGYSHDYIAHELDISQAAYSKLEKNETKLTVERLYRLSEILETPVVDLLEVDAKNIYNQDVKDQGVGYQGIENLYQENKEKTDKIILLYEERLKDKDALIEEMRKS